MADTQLLLFSRAAAVLSGDMDDLLELLFPNDPALGIEQLHLMEPEALQTRLATRGKAATKLSVD